ncbi:MAG: hypothetical protein KKI06_01410 [Euryarchaeota archaeon]|nr:hypothetical protein [Euryarchaeota archaeon]
MHKYPWCEGEAKSSNIFTLSGASAEYSAFACSTSAAVGRRGEGDADYDLMCTNDGFK